MAEIQIGINLFSVRDYCRTEDDLAKTLRRLKEIGYEAIQVSGVGPVDPQRIRSLLDENGQICCATHEGLERLTSGFEESLEKLQTLGCTFVALGSPGQDYVSEDGVAELAAKLDEIGKDFSEAGITFGYHNHAFEFQRVGKKTFYAELFDRTDPSHLLAELDTHWVVRGGADPVRWIERLSGRVPALHMKDFALIGSDPYFAEVGEGNLEWEAILEAARRAGVRWYIVEQDQPFPGRDIFDSLALSFENMREMGLS